MKMEWSLENQMKKVFKISLFIVLVSILSVKLKAQEEKFKVSLAGNLIISSDPDFEEIYGKWNFCPEIKLSFKMYKAIFLWAGYSFLSDTGTVPVLEEEAKSKQSFISFGAGYYGKVVNNLAYKAEVGLFYASYEEEAMEIKENGSAIGFRVEGALLYPVIKNLFVEATLGYMFGTDEINDLSIKLGGLKAGFGFTVTF